MSTNTHDHHNDRTVAVTLRHGLWLLPLAGAVTLWATFEHQPNPTTQFGEWARFVTTDRFLAQHVIGSILGQAIWILGAAALTALALHAGSRNRSAIVGFTLTVLGAAGLIAGFGVAAFAQPAIGHRPSRARRVRRS
jgi:cytochrome bd-type quinol oxidase subunit 2